MEREAVYVVVCVLELVVLLALAVRLRGRARRLERGAATQAHVLAAEQSRLATLEQQQARALERLAAVEQAQAHVAAEVRGLRDEFTIARVDESAAQVRARLDGAGAASAPSIEVHEDEGKTLLGAGEEVEEETRHWTKGDAAKVRAAVEAGGATRHPQTTPRALLAVVVAPPASASPPLEAGPPIVAAGLGTRPQSARVAPPPAPPQRTRTLAGVPAMLPQAPVDDDTAERTSWPTLKQSGVGFSTSLPAGSAPVVTAPRFPATLVSIQAQDAAPPTPPRDTIAMLAPSASSSDDYFARWSCLASTSLSSRCTRL